MPPASAHKRLRGAAKLRVAGWLLGRTELPMVEGRERGAGWHGRGMGSRGNTRMGAVDGVGAWLGGEAGRGPEMVVTTAAQIQI
jgi:hypothetical protein